MDKRIGRTFTIPPAPIDHQGHVVTVERRDIEKHRAYWLRCECGATTLVGEGYIDGYLDGTANPWTHTAPLGLRLIRRGRVAK